MRLGINHQITPANASWSGYFASFAKWVDLIRLYNHIDAYGWRVDPDTTYSDGTKAYDGLMQVAQACLDAGIAIDYIRDGAPRGDSSHWQALGGDWGSTTGNWRNDVVPKEAWGEVNAWISFMAKKLTTLKGLKLRWHGPNEQFDRGKDQWAYERAKSVYGTASYSRPWCSPALYGKREDLITQIHAWFSMMKYDKAFVKPATSKIICVNIYADWTEGVTIDDDTNLSRMLENIVIVRSLIPRDYTVVVSEFGFENVQINDVRKRVRYLATAAKLMKLLEFESACLYWDQGSYYINPGFLEGFKTIVNSEVSDDEWVFIIGALDSVGRIERFPLANNLLKSLGGQI